MSISSITSASYASTALASSYRNTSSSSRTVSQDDLDQYISGLTTADSGLTTLLQSLQSNFDQIDTNSDGLSADELETFLKSNGARTTQRPPQGGEHGAPPALSKDQLVEMRDQMAADDSDAAEGLTQVIKQFDAADSDQDGAISFEEMQAFTKANNIEMPKPPRGGPSQAGAMPPAESGDSSDSAISGADLFARLRQLCVTAYSAATSNSLSGSTLGAGVTA